MTENNANSESTRQQQEAEMKQTVHELITKIDQNPDQYQNYYDLAAVLVEGQDLEQAEELLMKALGLFDSNETARDLLTYGLGNVYYTAEEFDKAINWFTKIQSKQLQGDAYIMLAQSYLAKGDNKRSMAFALSAQGKVKHDPQVNLMIGDNLLALGEFVKAGEFYDKVLADDDHNGPANFNRGLVAMINGEPYSDYFVTANQFDPDYYAKSADKLKDIEQFVKQNKQ